MLSGQDISGLLTDYFLGGIITQKITENRAADFFYRYKAPQVLHTPQHQDTMRLLLAFAYLSLAATTHAATPTNIVDLGYAKYEGNLNNQTGNIEFLGMRFAAAPTGGLLVCCQVCQLFTFP